MIKITYHIENQQIEEFYEDDYADELLQDNKDGEFNVDSIHLESVDWNSQDYHGYETYRADTTRIKNLVLKMHELETVQLNLQLHNEPEHIFSAEFQQKMKTLFEKHWLSDIIFFNKNHL